MKVCGIMVSKEKSTRFPHKNRVLFEPNLDMLVDICGIENVYMFTDDNEIEKKCHEKGVNTILKTVNIDDEETYLDVLRYAYMSINKKYDFIVSIQCDSIGHKKHSILEAINRLSKDDHASECRAFDSEGNQSGFFVFKSDRIPEKWHHMCTVVSNGREIHYEHELDKI